MSSKASSSWGPIRRTDHRATLGRRGQSVDHRRCRAGHRRLQWRHDGVHEAAWTADDRRDVPGCVLLGVSFGGTFLALVPMVLDRLAVPEPALWSRASGLMVLY